LDESSDTFGLGAVATVEKMIPSGSFFSTKINVVGCMGVEPKRDEIALAEGFCDSVLQNLVVLYKYSLFIFPAP
jgi:hypothetical protein